VNGCRSHRELVGGYVLGALEPAEMEAMRRHLAGCADCAQEQRALATLPGLLDRVEPTEIPPPTPPPALEEAVLDRFVREGAARPSRRHGRPAPLRDRLGRSGAARPSPPMRLRRLGYAATALAAAVVLGLLLLWGDSAEETYARAPLSGPSAAGTAVVERVPAGTRVRLSADGLAAGGQDAVYELWCVRVDGDWVSGGTFRARPDGSAEAQLTAAVRPGDYHLVVVTRRPARDPGGTRGATVLRGELEY